MSFSFSHLNFNLRTNDDKPISYLLYTGCDRLQDGFVFFLYFRVKLMLFEMTNNEWPSRYFTYKFFFSQTANF